VTTGIIPILKAIIYLVTFYKVVSFPSGFFTVNDTSNKLDAFPSPQSIVDI
jgi:hypothetical protein